jgi:hypothetical protein
MLRDIAEQPDEWVVKLRGKGRVRECAAPLMALFKKRKEERRPRIDRNQRGREVMCREISDEGELRRMCDRVYYGAESNAPPPVPSSSAAHTATLWMYNAAPPVHHVAWDDEVK